MEIIQKWFADGCNYDSGVVIYRNLPKHNAVLLRAFPKKQNSFNSEKLKYELRKFESQNQQAVFIQAIKKELTPEVLQAQNPALQQENKQVLLFHELPEILRPILLQANTLFKENCLLKVTLNELPEHAERKALELQIKIDHNFRQNAQCWKQIDFYLQHRVVPELSKSEFEHLTPAGQLRQQQLLYASISKLNARLWVNQQLLQKAEYFKVRSRLERQILKQEENLLKQNQKLMQLSSLIDGK